VGTPFTVLTLASAQAPDHTSHLNRDPTLLPDALTAWAATPARGPATLPSLPTGSDEGTAFSAMPNSGPSRHSLMCAEDRMHNLFQEKQEICRHEGQRLAIEFLVLAAGVMPTPGETPARSFASTGYKEGAYKQAEQDGGRTGAADRFTVTVPRALAGQAWASIGPGQTPLGTAFAASAEANRY
jgi:hypothetical protein